MVTNPVASSARRMMSVRGLLRKRTAAETEGTSGGKRVAELSAESASSGRVASIGPSDAATVVENRARPSPSSLSVVVPCPERASLTSFSPGPKRRTSMKTESVSGVVLRRLVAVIAKFARGFPKDDQRSPARATPSSGGVSVRTSISSPGRTTDFAASISRARAREPDAVRTHTLSFVPRFRSSASAVPASRAGSPPFADIDGDSSSTTWSVPVLRRHASGVSAAKTSARRAKSSSQKIGGRISRSRRLDCVDTVFGRGQSRSEPTVFSGLFLRKQ